MDRNTIAAFLFIAIILILYPLYLEVITPEKIKKPGSNRQTSRQHETVTEKTTEKLETEKAGDMAGDYYTVYDSPAEEKNITISKAEDFNAVTGKGVTGSLEGKKVALGNKKMMEEASAKLDEVLEKEALDEQQKGKTVSFLAVDREVRGYVVISDKIKATSKKAIQSLKEKGIAVIMLTGDNEDTARAVANELDLTDFKAGMLPQDKQAEVARLQQEGKHVAMVGDGINDAPALAQSNVGIAMGTGTDVAIESAAITLVKGDLHGIVKAKNLSDAVMRNIKQNLFFALVYNSIGVPVAAGVLYPFFGILLSPMIAALAMSFSSVSVIANALRLRAKSLE